MAYQHKSIAACILYIAIIHCNGINYNITTSWTKKDTDTGDHLDLNIIGQLLRMEPLLWVVIALIVVICCLCCLLIGYCIKVHKHNKKHRLTIRVQNDNKSLQRPLPVHDEVIHRSGNKRESISLQPPSQNMSLSIYSYSAVTDDKQMPPKTQLAPRSKSENDSIQLSIHKSPIKSVSNTAQPLRFRPRDGNQMMRPVSPVSETSTFASGYSNGTQMTGAQPTTTSNVSPQTSAYAPPRAPPSVSSTQRVNHSLQCAMQSLAKEEIKSHNRGSDPCVWTESEVDTKPVRAVGINEKVNDGIVGMVNIFEMEQDTVVC
eukprot:712231_1